MDKKEYIIRQLSRTNHKSYENYCVTRIFHKVDNLNVQFVTQQMFKRVNGRIALADLYLPQIDMIIEVDESHHIKNKEDDDARTKEIIANKIKAFEEIITYNLEPIRIAAWKGIENINQEIDTIVAEINSRIQDPQKPFIPWNCAYPDSKYYKTLGKLDVIDRPSFKTIQDVANLFNLYPDKKGVYNTEGRYIGTQKSFFADKMGSNVRIWCPKLTINADDYTSTPYLNEISVDGNRITESPKDPSKAIQFVKTIIDGKESYLTKRYVFAMYKDSVGEDRYRFRGVFEINKDESRKAGYRIWDKTSDIISIEEYHKHGE